MEYVPIGNLTNLSMKKVDPKKIDETVVHYSIPNWPTLTPVNECSTEIKSTKFLLPDEEHLLISRLNPSTHKVWRVTKNMSNLKRLGSTEWAVLIPEDPLDIDFLNAIVQSENFKFQLNAYVTGTTNSHQRVRMPDFKRLLVPVRDSDERRRIGLRHALLRRFNESASQVRTLVDELLEGLFISWFINSRDLETDQASYDRVAPDGWRVCQMRDLYEIQRGLSYTSEGLCDESDGTPMVNLASFVFGGGYKPSGLKHYSMECREKYTLKKGDVLYATLEQTHDLSLVASPLVPPASLEDEAIFSQDLLRARPISDQSPGRGYLYYWSKTYRMDMAMWSNGTTINRIPPSALEQFQILIPPKEYLQRFEEIYETLNEYCREIEKMKADFSDAWTYVVEREIQSGQL